MLEGLAAADCQLVAVCDDSPTALAQVASWPMAGADTRLYTDYRDLLAHESIDLLCHAGVDSERAEVLVAGARQGLHLIAEKPLANSLTELAALRQAVTAAGVELSMLLTMRFEPAYRAVRQAVAAGLIGEVCQGAMQKSYRLGTRPAWQCNRTTFSGIIPFVGIHALDLIRWCSGRQINHGGGFAANTGHPEPGDLEDNA